MAFLKVEPPSRDYRDEDVIYIDLDVDRMDDDMPLKDRLNRGSLCWEDLIAEETGAAKDPGTEKGREAKMQEICDHTGRQICELLNFVLYATGTEVSAESTFEIVDEVPEPEEGDYDASPCAAEQEQKDAADAASRL